MKEKLMIFLIGIILFTSCGSKEPVYEVRNKDGIQYMYDSANKKYVSGTIESYIEWRDGGRTVTKRMEFKDGLLHGKCEVYSEGRNPILKYIETYKKGVLDGLKVEYYLDLFGEGVRRKKVEYEYINGDIVSEKHYNHDQSLNYIFKKEKEYSYKEYYKDGIKTKLAIINEYGFERKVTTNSKIKPKTLHKSIKRDLSGDGVKFYTYLIDVRFINYTGTFPVELRIDENTDDPDIVSIISISVPVDLIYTGIERRTDRINHMPIDEQNNLLDKGYIVIIADMNKKGQVECMRIMSEVNEDNPEDPAYYIQYKGYKGNKPTYKEYVEVSVSCENLFERADKFMVKAYKEAMKNKDEWYDKNKD